jgi:uncharacterized protein (TIRG00374 family)
MRTDQGHGGAGRRFTSLRDPRILIGLAITAGTLWFALRGVSFATLARDIARANLAILLIPSVPAYLASLYVRALRWRHLILAVARVERGPVFRATSVGFMVNNVFPLRIGEVVRAWYLAREVGVSRAAIFATVIVERLIDAAVVLSLAALVLGSRGAAATGLDPWAVLPPLAALVAVPVVFIVALRMAPRRTVALGARVSGAVLPQRWTQRVEHLLRHFAEGMGGLRGRHSVVWVVIHTVNLWLVISIIPFAAALMALGIDLGGPVHILTGAYNLLIWVGAAVALPSAPGFFGPYHAACWVALQPLGVSKEAAVALGTLSHAAFWVTVTATGLFVLRFRRTRLEETLEAGGSSFKDPAAR